eukprot:3901395-Rhodomonas_salina.1
MMFPGVGSLTSSPEYSICHRLLRLAVQKVLAKLFRLKIEFGTPKSSSAVPFTATVPVKLSVTLVLP